MPPPAASKPIFLSYSRADRPACLALRAALKQAGLAAFQDDDAIRAGDRWVSELQSALSGCSAFVVLVGRDGVRRWVGAEVEVALTRHLSPQADADRLPIFPVLLDDTPPETLPPFLALFQATRWPHSADPACLPGELIEAIRQRTTRFDESERFDRCPFVGLAAFRQTDARLFFGRRKETLEALACLGDPRETNPERVRPGVGERYYRWLQIEGGSGAGKSSLVQAGLFPLIDRGALWARTGFEHWQVFEPMVPGSRPLENLAATLESGLVEDRSRRDSLERERRLRSDPRALAMMLRDARTEGRAFLLFVDQFEELFTFAEAEHRTLFDAALAHALQDPECPLFLISTVRADFLDRFELLPRLEGLLNSHCARYLLPLVGEQGLREIIEGPARLAGLDVREVTSAILDDARNEPGALPLVENALSVLWDQREGDRLPGHKYVAAGGLVGLLRAQADALLARMDADRSVPKGRYAALELLLALTRVNDEGRNSRQRIDRGEAVRIAGFGDAKVGEHVVQVLSGGGAPDAPRSAHTGALRLITTPSEQGRHYVDLIHETLIRAHRKDEKTGKLIGYWPTLFDYIDRHRDRVLDRQLATVHADRLRRALERRVDRWARSGPIGRVWHLGGLPAAVRYRKVTHGSAPEANRFRHWSQVKAGVQLALLIGALGVLAESAWWVSENPELPFWYALVKPLWVLGWTPVPEMVEIRGSLWFKMGCVQGRDDTEGGCDRVELPSHEVSFTKPYTMGKYEVSFLEYDTSIWDRKRKGVASTAEIRIEYPPDQGWGRFRRPVINVNWYEARAYAQWLKATTGRDYRLPTEAHWEYAVRADSNDAYWWGPRFEPAKANCENRERQTTRLGRFPANQFGLHDTAGNVWEWVDAAKAYSNQPIVDPPWDERAGKPPANAGQVLRGGSWSDNPRNCRAAYRDGRDSDDRNDGVGFRVCCGVPIE